jgi:hypothetical protein
VLADDQFDRIAAEPIVPIAHEEWLAIGTATLAKPSAERFDTVLAERSRAFLSSLAHAAHVRAGAECKVAAVQVDQLRHAKASLQGEEKKHPVSPTRPGRWIGCPDESFALGAGEEVT